MNIKDYFKDHIFMSLLSLLLMIGLSLFLFSVGNSMDTLLIILVSWCLVLLMIFFVKYWCRKKKLDQLLKIMADLDKGYLIAEVMEKPERADDKVYYQLLKMAEKSMLEEIATVKRDRLEYRDYIEQWIHEVKTPLSALKLMCDNHKSDLTRNIQVEIEKVNHFVEQALYYARSETLEKDYLIREVTLSEVIHNCVAENKRLLLKNQVNIELEDCERNVYTDEKWVGFILDQLIVNAVKYRKNNPYIRFQTICQNDNILLLIKDNGIGIGANDLPRIFEKGFTGTNGRVEKSSTGIGLYLCKRLCDKLGIGLHASSNEDETIISLVFFQNHFIKMQD